MPLHNRVDPQPLSHLQSLSGINAWGLNVFRASDFAVQKRVLTCVNFKIYQVIDNSGVFTIAIH